MKQLFYYLLFWCNFISAQNRPKIDTIFSGKYNVDRIEHSKMADLTINLNSKCLTEEVIFDKSNRIEYNPEYAVLTILKEFNQFSKSNIFADYKYIIYSKYCYNSDFFDDIILIEFHYSDKIKSDKFQKKIKGIVTDEMFFNYPNDKLIYYTTAGNHVCYLLMSTADNPNNAIFNDLKERLEKFE